MNGASARGAPVQDAAVQDGAVQVVPVLTPACNGNMTAFAPWFILCNRRLNIHRFR